MAALAALFLAGCAPWPVRPGERAYLDVAYAAPEGKPLRLDLYVPKASRPVPVVVWFHGGGWRYGDKRYRLLVRDLTREGFAVASVQYRLSGEASWPAQREDGQAALGWLRRHGASHGIDASRLGLAGDSAGGHLAAWIGLQEKTPRVRAVLALYPPTDLAALARWHGDRPGNLLDRLLDGTAEENPDRYQAASPVTHAGPDAPPFLFLHGDRDPVVPLEQSRTLRRLLNRSGVEAGVIVRKEAGHAFGLDSGLMGRTAEFFRRHLTAP